MLRSIIKCSRSLHNSTPLVEGALQLYKLYLAHRNAASDKNTEACQAIEDEFLKEVETLRPFFTMSASLEVAQQYSKQTYRSLKYFGLHDDPLTRQLDQLLGREAMRKTARGAQSIFKGVTPSKSMSGSQNLSRVLTSLYERAETTLPSELPNPPKIDETIPRRPGAVRVPLRHRGHWVLQEPEIAITKNERREDPW
ncbi:unnamed protein product [Phytomonas sp. EM1]|nr:unnamed protein product [Phytomonas sp. EM1]|eukprot:CCW61729.1 unnamed protein product [Phytomonas sp. isolate EM1]